VLENAEAQLSAGLLQSGRAGNLLREIDGADRRPDAYEMAI
jgi:hypothetical protein